MAGVFACECGFRGVESELEDKKCPRCGKSVKETDSPELRYKAYEKAQQEAERATKKTDAKDDKAAGVGEGA
jgi:hypothetical protein